MLAAKNATEILNEADLICSPDEVSQAVARLAREIKESLGDKHPLVLSVMGGAVVFTGQILPQLSFPLEFDYIHVSRYGNTTQGGSL
jgi:hypoxanthine phosphoribosyltransferase